MSSSGTSKNILVLGVQVPFTSGGAELLLENLCKHLRSAGHNVDTVSLPFSALPKERILDEIAIWRSLQLSSFSGRKVDLVIGTKFPTYAVRHPNKVLWLIHQHRQAYELVGTRFGDFEVNSKDEALRQMIVKADNASLKECKSIFTISENVSRRLALFNDVSSEALEPPLPFENAYQQGEKGNYILSVGRLCSIKRVDLLLKALPNIKDPLKVKIVGSSDEPAIEEYLRSEVRKHSQESRVEFLGRVPTPELLELYANCFAVYYAPFDEDYGFVTLEALESGKPVVTCEDSGSVLDYIQHERNGMVSAPKDEAIAESFNRLLEDDDLYSRLTEQAEPQHESRSWEEIIERLTNS